MVFKNSWKLKESLIQFLLNSVNRKKDPLKTAEKSNLSETKTFWKPEL